MKSIAALLGFTLIVGALVAVPIAQQKEIGRAHV